MAPACCSTDKQNTRDMGSTRYQPRPARARDRRGVGGRGRSRNANETKRAQLRTDITAQPAGGCPKQPLSAGEGLPSLPHVPRSQWCGVRGVVQESNNRRDGQMGRRGTGYDACGGGRVVSRTPRRSVDGVLGLGTRSWERRYWHRGRFDLAWGRGIVMEPRRGRAHMHILHA